MRRLFLLSSLLILLPLAGALALFPAAAPAAARQPQNHYYLLRYTIDRPNEPALYYEALTLRIDLNGGDLAALLSDDEEMTFAYDPDAGSVTVTTSAKELQVVVRNPQTEEELGVFSKAVLKYDKKWAWSHGLDDNVDLIPSIEAFSAKGWRGMLYMIGQYVDAEREEDWILDAPDLHRLLVQGWGVGNQTWDDKLCSVDDPRVARENILQGYERLETVVENSPVPDYRLIAFAAPCLSADYYPFIQEMRENGETDVLYDEAANSFRIVVDPGVSGDPIWDEEAEKYAYPYTYTMSIGRDAAIGEGSTGVFQVKEEMDWMADNSTADHHLWYNTLSHGGDEADLSEVIDYAYNNYGPGGSNELWVAPSDEIYSYLLIRNESVVTRSGPFPLNTIYLPGIFRGE